MSVSPGWYINRVLVVALLDSRLCLNRLLIDCLAEVGVSRRGWYVIRFFGGHINRLSAGAY